MAPKAREDNAELVGLMWQAVAEPIGLLIVTDDPERLKQRLRWLRDAENDPELERLQFASSPLDDGDVVIVKTQKAESERESRIAAAAAMLESGE